jgi:O-antigen ligase
MVPIIILLYKVFNKFNLLDSFLIVLGGVINFIVGARGPIVCIVIFILFYILANSIVGKQKSKFVLTLISLIFIIIIVVLNSNLILGFINNILIKRNIHSRTIYTLLNFSKIDFSAGRTDIYITCLDIIKNNPLIGIGIGGDRVLLEGTYPHNILLEILMNFGILLGSICIIFILFLTIKSIFSKNFVNRSLSIMFLGIGFIQLFFSGSYLTSPNFWLYIAICFCSVFKIKTKANIV